VSAIAGESPMSYRARVHGGGEEPSIRELVPLPDRGGWVILEP